MNNCAESVLDNDLNESLFLPKIWQMIYHEYHLDHHLIFNQNDMPFLSGLSSDRLNFSILEHESFLSSFVVELATCSCLKDMKEKIGLLSKEEKISFYAYYLRLMKHWNHLRKKTLN